jgi:hypothetical protein
MMAQRLPVEQVSTEDFINRVVPKGGHYVIAWKESDATKSWFSHKVFQTATDAVNAAKQITFQRKEVYYALASFKQGFHKAPDDKMVVRVQANVRALRALWVDVDVGKGGYNDQHEALQGLQQFCKGTHVPPPSLLVSSGSGLHCYWTFDTDLQPHQWQGLATALKEACQQHGFKIDPGITIDSARILRLPGTFNYKRPKNPSPVELLYALSTDYTYDTIRAALDAWADPLPPRPITPEIQASMAEVSDGLAVNTEPSYVKHIVKRCEVMKRIHETAGAECSEPLWTATLQLVKACADGDDWVHPLSEGHPGYDEAGTDRKYHYRLQNSHGPTLCSTFEQHMPTACKVCPHYNKIKSPISIGKDKYDDPLGIPFPWRIGANGLCIEKWTRADDGEDGSWDYAFPFTIEGVTASRYVFNNGAGETGYVFDMVVRNASRKVRVLFPSSIIGDTVKTKQFMGNYAFPLTGKSKADELGELMSSWLNKLTAAKAVKNASGSLGWQSDESFCLGHNTIMADGSINESMTGQVDSENVRGRYRKHGKFENWQRAANHIAHQKHPELGAILASAFAAPLMRFTGNPGFLLSIVSNKSGVGKSTAMAVAQGVWGDPNGINSINDTENAVSEKLGFLSSLPAYWDEIKGRRAMETMAHMAFRISEGRTKARLSPTGKMMPVKTWNTILLAASNASLIEHIQHADLHTDAGILRVFEIRVDIDHTGQAPPLASDIFDNFGHAGEPYTQFLVKNREKLGPIINAMQERYKAELNAQSRERFWISGMSVLVAGAMFAKKLGLVDFDIPSLEAYLKDAVRSLQLMHSSAVLSVSPMEVLARYLDDTFSERLVTDVLVVGKGSVAGGGPRITYLPQRGKPEWQMAKDSKQLLVPISRYKDWLRQRGFALQVASDLDGFVQVTKGDYTLGGRTSASLPRCKAYLIDANGVPLLEPLFDY